MNIEQRTQEIGRSIHTAVAGEVPSLFDRKRWMGRLMEWAMEDPGFKTRLFRFIDVLPSLNTDELVVRLLREYFGGDPRIPLLIRRGLERIAGGRVMPAVAALAVRKGVETLARQFIAGRGPEKALNALRSLENEGAQASVDLLGEAVLSDSEAQDYAARYVHLLSLLGNGRRDRAEVSLKVSSFYSQIDPVDWEGSIRATMEGLRPVFETAQRTGTAITLDMEHYHIKDLTLAIFRSLCREFPDVSCGVALQAYLKDARRDLDELLRFTKAGDRRIAVRLVKGAYWDYENVTGRQKGWPIPVFLNKDETDRNFEDLTRVLLGNTHLVHSAIATHNIRSLSHAISVSEHLGISPDAFEFQMLYGMAEPIRGVLLKKGFRMRVYTPVGELIPCMAYLVRRLLENTSGESFLRRSFFERSPVEVLLRPPVPVEPRKNGSILSETFVNEPPLDFSIAENRQRMEEALLRVKDNRDRRCPLIIDGREVSTEREIVSVNPARPEEVIGRVSSASGKEASEALAGARKAWALWSKVPAGERAGHLFRAAERLRQRRFELAAIEVLEVGKTWQDADADVTEAIDYLEYYGREMIRLGKGLRLGDIPGEENEYVYRPRGVGVVISPWNFPLAIPAGMVSAAVVAGNCVVFKPSGVSPVTGSFLCRAFKEAGLPPGVLQFLPGPGGEAGEYLVAHPDVDFIAFTGSRDVGLRIVRLAAETHEGQRNVKKVVAEMGGKNAIIVDETADLDEAVKGVLESALGFQGQKCSACSRVIVVGSVAGTFVRRLREAMASVRIGPTEEPGNSMGPVVDRDALLRIRGYITLGELEGRLIYRRDAGDKGFFVGPVIIGDVAVDSRVAQEEIFGPVLAVIEARDMDEAIRAANSTSYELTGGIYSRSPDSILKARMSFRAGNLYINRKITGAMVGRQPFGGAGMSGIGSKAGGPDYLLQFMNPRCVSENTLRRGFVPEQQEQ